MGAFSTDLTRLITSGGDRAAKGSESYGPADRQGGETDPSKGCVVMFSDFSLLTGLTSRQPSDSLERATKDEAPKPSDLWVLCKLGPLP
eukprot:5500903-Amphidinium_carterae.2